MKGRAAAAVAVLLAFAVGWWLGGRRDDVPEREVVPAPVAAPAPAALPRAEAREPVAPPPRPRAKRPEPVATPAGAEAPVQVADPSRPAGRLRTGRVTLLSRTKHDDYEKATFSFEHGLRDDPGLLVTRNDWEIQFAGRDEFSVHLVTDDKSTITDLGAFESLDELARSAPQVPDPTLTTAPAVLGHAYLVHSADRDSDHYSVLHVVDLVPGDRVTFDWADWVPPPRADRGALALSDATRHGLAALLDGSRAREQAARRERFGEMRDPADLVIQVRTGMQGGNRSVVTLADPSTWELATRSETEVDFQQALPRTRGALAFVRGGYLPEGKALVIESVDVYATAPGDSNGHGAASLVVGSERILSLGDDEGPVRDWFAGRVVVRPGDEDSVTVHVANSSAVEARIRGRFVPLAEAEAIEPVPFRPGPAPDGAARAGGAAGTSARSSLLADPRAVLQVRAGHGGGNPMRVSLLGKSGGYLRKMSDAPIAADTSPESSRDSESVGWVQGGRIPRGKAFVVTRVDWELRTTKGRGAASVTVAGTQVAAITPRDEEDAKAGTWVGRIEVPAGSEERVLVEASWYSFASATLAGEFVDLPPASK